MSISVLYMEFLRSRELGTNSVHISMGEADNILQQVDDQKAYMKAAQDASHALSALAKKHGATQHEIDVAFLGEQSEREYGC